MTAAGALAGRRALVTGGTKGIGRGVVLAMARAGADVLTCHRADDDSAASLRAELAGLPGKHHVVRADVSDPADARRLLAECESALGGLEVLVNNAGAFRPRPYAELSAGEWSTTLAGNLTATHQLTQGALRLLAPGSSIVNFGSTVTFVGMAGGVHYTAAKAAIVGYTRSLARELGPEGIRVNVISPGRIDTEALDALGPEEAARQRAIFSRFNALGRLGTVAEIAAVAVFLAGPVSGYVTGQNIHVDGCV
ncbi:short-chain dehydrogenase [Actinoplanes ianthinogenes]|uniref:Short-chain dehydrogenase n=1 Tax=Actinoplanes ianthinogenes TaxID=122358 RepID=A0ABM7M8L7_9ACTN|nr:SDR family oxidoreductase [Actinoplanes ianthinogenes]BCJ48003.1 short-chain dehydrogenase [Actinoplanes ianthinogenes]GGR05712.1 short-chain dehydrogenase [Actinoplanes ianthinogenes]